MSLPVDYVSLLSIITDSTVMKDKAFSILWRQAGNTPFSIPQYGYLQIIYLIFQFALSLGKALPYIFSQFNLLRDLSEISRGGGGVETEGGSQLFETAEKGGVMKNGPLKGEGSCKYVSVIMYRFTHRRKKKFFIL